MPNIQYVFLSDTHFGANNSLLTNLQPNGSLPAASQPSPILEQLGACLQTLIAHNEQGQKPTLILGGDILELALCDTNIAAMAFERFIELVLPANGESLFEKIIYIPGNHDHHLWEEARETQYVNYISKKVPAGTALEAPWHTTKMFIANDLDPLPCYFLTKLIQRYPHLQEMVIYTAYPNLGILNQNTKHGVVFTHGHFCEPIYLLMSNLRDLVFPGRPQPVQVWDIEAENFAWIDFFWSTMGRSGGVGEDIGLLYDKMQDKDQMDIIISNIAHNLTKQPGLLGKTEVEVIKLVLRLTLGRYAALERTVSAEALSPKAALGWQHYVEGTLRQQLLLELKGTLPEQLTLVFGHTHKPFQQQTEFKGYPDKVKVYNSGGWVVDTENIQPRHGASVILIDQNLEVVSLQMYLEAVTPANYAVKLNEVLAKSEGNSAFYQQIAQVLETEPDCWQSFSQVAAKEVNIRNHNLQVRIKG